MVKVVDGRQLKAGRVILGLTVQQMADIAGIHRNSVSRTERCKTLSHSAYAAVRIQAALEGQGIGFAVNGGKAHISFCASQRRVKTPYARKARPY